MAITKYQMQGIRAFFGDFFEDYSQQTQDMLDKYDWATIEHYMNREIAEELHMELAPCSHERFLLAYMMEHVARFGEDFSIS